MINDTNMTCQLWNFEIANQILYVSVGKSVGGKENIDLIDFIDDFWLYSL